jgi:hypothetical protein
LVAACRAATLRLCVRKSSLSVKSLKSVVQFLRFRLGALRLLRRLASNHLKSLSMNNLHLIANFRNQARSSLIVPNRVILCVSKYRKEPGVVLEGWSFGPPPGVSCRSRKARPDYSIPPPITPRKGICLRPIKAN